MKKRALIISLLISVILILSLCCMSVFAAEGTEKGDINGDSVVDINDAIYLLRHTMMPSRYPVAQPADVNGTGEVDIDDAIYLLRHTMMPSRYPIVDDTHTHSLTHHDAKSATCFVNGNIEYWSCSACNKNYSDANATTEVLNTVIEAAHTGGTEIRNSKAPSETEEGYTGDTYCLGCGEKIATGETIGKLDHTHVLIKKNRKEATCTEDGNIEYWSCSSCGKHYADQDCIREITIAETVIEASHSLTHHDAKAATCTEKGHNAYENCSRCNYTTYSEINALGHSASDWIIVTPPSYDAEGLRRKECTVCRAVLENEPIDKLVDETIYVTSVSLNTNSLNLRCGHSDTLTATVLPSNATDTSISWASSNISVATVSNGVVTAIGEGTAIITVTTSNGKTAECVVTVDASAVIKYELSENQSFYIVSGIEGRTETLEIPFRHDGLRVQAIKAGAFAGNTDLKEVILPNSIEQIYAGAFMNCSNLEIINLPDSLTVIGESAFENCTSLKEITIPSLTETVSDRAFYSCTALKTVNVLAGVKNIGASTFAYCSSLEDISIGEGLETIGLMAFDYCTALKSFDMPDTVISVGNTAFRHNEALKSVRFSTNLTAIGNACFQYCISLDNVELHSGINIIGASCFSYCSGMKTLRILGDINTLGNSAFYECTGLETVYYASSIYCDLGINNYVFYNAGANNNGITFTLSAEACIPDRLFEPQVDLNRPKLIKLIVEDGATGVNYLENYNTLPYLTEIELPDTITYIKKGCFDNTAWWENQAEGEVYIGNIFYGYKGLLTNELDISNDTVCIAFGALEGQTPTSLKIPFVGAIANGEKNTHFGYIFGAQTVGEQAEYIPSELASVIVKNCHYTIEENAFDDCEFTVALEHAWNEWAYSLAPTCTEGGTEYRDCPRCGDHETRDVEANGHELTHIEAVDATCAEDGNVEYWSCSVCDKMYSDAEATSEITDVTIQAGHFGGTEIRDQRDPTVDEEGYTGDTYCLTCGNKLYSGNAIAKLNKITYHNVDGANNSNPSAYASEDTPIILDSLSKDYYAFIGWYSDEEFTNLVTEIGTDSSGDIDLYARWEAVEYTATFMADGTVVATVNFTVETQSITEPNVPFRSGYSGRWENYTLGTEDITINAIYSAYDIIVTWVSSDGTLLKETGCQANEVPSFGDETPTKASDSQYSYTFVRWIPEVTAITEDTVFVAVFEKTPRTSYTISYDANGGTDAPDSQIKTAGSNVYLSSGTPTRSGYVFIGWRCANDGNTYKAGDSFSVNADVTLYAVWGHNCSSCGGDGKVASTYVCTSCSGTGGTTKTEYIEVNCSSCGGSGRYNTTCSSCIGGMSNIIIYCSCGGYTWPYNALGQKCPYCGRQGSVFDYDSCSTCGGDGVKSSSCTSCSGYGYKMTSVSKFYNCSTCGGSGTRPATVTCSVCAGKGVTADSHSSYTVNLVNDNETLTSISVTQTMPYKLTVPTKNGYTFLGWFDSVDGGTQYTDGEGICLSVWSHSSNKTLYARWSAKYYTITYDCDDDISTDNLPLIYSPKDADILLNSQSKDYYTFSWQIDGTVVNSIDTSLAKDIVVNGIWTPIEYEIVYDLDGGSSNNQTVYTIETDTFSLSTPTKTGYLFAGWTGSNGEELSETVTIECGSHGNLSYKANWIPCQYTVIFDANEGSGNQNEITVTFGEEMPTITEAPTRDGYIFIGYYDAVSDGTKYYNADLSSAKEWDKASTTTLYARWKGITYYVSFDANNGTGTMQNQSFEYGVSTNLSSNAYASTGYSFAGWNTEADGSGTSYADNASVLNLTNVSGGTVTLYAQWTAKDVNVTLDTGIVSSYTVSFDLNGASGIAPAAKTVTQTVGLTYPTVPTRSGYAFAGWYSNSSCTGTPYDFSAYVTEDITLYAKWIAMSSTSYTREYFDVMNHTSSSSRKTVTASSYSGYNLYYFTCYTAGSYAIYESWVQGDFYFEVINVTTGTTIKTTNLYNNRTSDIASFTANAGDVICIRTKRYSSSYNMTSNGKFYVAGASYPSAGGKASNLILSTEQLTYNQNFTLDVPTRDGYTFLGWYDGENGTGTQYTDATGASIKVWDKEENTTLYAKWEATSYNVTLDKQNGTGGADSVTATYDSEMPEVAAPTRTGYTFMGYYTAISGGTKYYNADMTSAAVWSIAENTTLYAHWSANSYDIFFNNQGGEETPSVSATYDASLPDATKPTRTGYTFLGYYDAAVGGTPYYDENMNSLMLWTRVASVELFAHWEANDYTITYDANGGTVEETSQNVTYNVQYTLHIPTRTGYTFDGWYIEDEKFEEGTWTLTNDVALKAKWTANTYTITYDDVLFIPNSIKVTFDYNYSGSASTEVIVENGEVLEYPTIPTRSGYYFVGWYTDAECTEIFDFSGTLTEDLVLYAKWVDTGSVLVKTYSSYWTTNGPLLTSNNTSSNSTSKYELTAYASITVTFSYKVSSEAYYDKLIISKNDEKLVEASGDLSYVEYSVELNAGDRLTFQYSKDGSTNSYNDCAYISNLAYTINDTPYTSTATAGCPNGGLKYDADSSYVYEVEFDSEYTLLIPVREGYTFNGWYYGSTMIESGVWSYAENVTLVASWSKNSYTITYDANGGDCDTSSQTVVFDESYELPTITRTGYTFAGWYSGDDLYEGGTWTTAENVTLTAKWTPHSDTEYVVNHYQQNIENDEYTLCETENLTGTSDDSITPGVNTYEGFTSPDAETVTISPDGSLVVNYYYTRNYYTVTVVGNGGSSCTVSQKYGSAIDTTGWSTRPGHTLGGFYLDLGLTQEYTDTTMPAQDKTVYAYWSDEDLSSHFTYTTSGSSVTITGYVGSNDIVIIPTMINGKTVTAIAAKAFENQSSILSITVPDSVTSIGEGAFKGCNSLVSITLPFVGSSRSVSSNDPYSSCYSDSQLFGYIFGSTIQSNTANGTNLVYQGQSYHSSAYPYCKYYIPSSLRSVTITNATGISAYAFYGCSNLTSITFNSEVETIYSFAFYGCSGLTSFTVPASTTTISSYAFYNNTSLSTLTFNSNVTSIGDYAFYNCSNVTSISLPSTLKTIGDYAFYNNQLSSLTIPTSVTSIGSHAFANNTAITSLTIPGNVKTIGAYAFSDCSNVSTLTLNSGIQTISIYAFQNMKITTVTVPDSVTSINEGAFKGCNSLVSITLPFVGSSRSVSSNDPYSSCYSDSQLFGYIFGSTIQSDTANGTNLVYQGQSYYSSAYPYCKYYIPSSLRSVTITDVTGISAYAFYGCSNLTSITFNSEVETIYSFAFYGCSGLTSFTVPASTTTISSYAFYNNTSLSTLTFNSNVTSIGDYAFYNCSNVTSISLPSTLKTIGNCAFYNNQLSSLTIPTSVTSIGSHAFANNTAITSLTIPGNVKTIGAYAFSDCSNVSTLTLNSGIQTIYSYAFQNMKITTVTVPDSVTSIGEGAFNGCNSLVSITLPFVGSSSSVSSYNPDSSCYSDPQLFGYIFGSTTQSNTANGTNLVYQGQSYYSSAYPYRKYYIPSSLRSVTITDATGISAYAFYGCSNLTSITFNSEVETIYGHAFYGCSGLTSFTVPASTTTISSYAFYNNTSLSTLTFNSNVTSIGDYAFYNCSNVTSISLPSTLKTIGDYAFYNNQLSSLTIPTSVTSIGSHAFANNTAITSLTIPGNVKTIGANAFSDCSNVSTLTLNSGIQTISIYAFQNMKITTVTVPDSVTSIGVGAFKGCNSLVSITLPFVGSSSSVSSYAPDSSENTDSQLFGYIFGSTTQSNTANYTNLVYQGQSYSSSTYLYRKYYIPSSLRSVTITNATGISAYAFYGCSNLTNITINSAAQNNVYYNAFNNCTATVIYN